MQTLRSPENSCLRFQMFLKGKLTGTERALSNTGLVVPHCSGELYPANSLISSNLRLFPPPSLVWCIWVQGTVLKVCMRLEAAKASPETSRNPTDTAPRQSCSYKINQISARRSFPTICSNKSWVRNVSSS